MLVDDPLAFSQSRSPDEAIGNGFGDSVTTWQRCNHHIELQGVGLVHSLIEVRCLLIQCQ